MVDDVTIYKDLDFKKCIFMHQVLYIHCKLTLHPFPVITMNFYFMKLQTLWKLGMLYFHISDCKDRWMWNKNHTANNCMPAHTSTDGGVRVGNQSSHVPEKKKPTSDTTWLHSFKKKKKTTIWPTLDIIQFSKRVLTIHVPVTIKLLHYFC